MSLNTYLANSLKTLIGHNLQFGSSKHSADLDKTSINIQAAGILPKTRSFEIICILYRDFSVIVGFLKLLATALHINFTGADYLTKRSHIYVSLYKNFINGI